VDIPSVIRSIPTGVFLVIAAFPIAMTAVAVYASLHARKTARVIVAVPTSQVFGATDGYVALEGKVRAINNQTLVAPLTQSPCCWFHVKIEKFVRSWRTLGEYTSSEPFLLVDTSGTCAVFPDKAEVTPTDRSIWYGPTALPKDRNPRRVAPGESPEGMLRIDGTPGHKFRYTEERIYAGDPLYALAQLESGPAGDDADDDGEEPVIDAEPCEQHADSNHANLDALEDQEAAVADGTWLGADRFDTLRRAARKVTTKRLTASGSRAQPFLLSTTPPDKLLTVNCAGWKAALFVAAVPLSLALLLIWLRLR
jgi:hypothetical protein